MPKKIGLKLGGKRWYPCVQHSTQEFWATKSFVSSGKERYPLGNAYFIDEQGFRQYCVKFVKGVTVYIDPAKSNSKSHRDNLKTGKQLLDRFYELKLKPLVFKWIKAKTPLETSHWICVYPAHYLVVIEKSESGQMHAKDHLATLYHRGSNGLVMIAQQEYEGHLRGNLEYSQPSIIQSELREWRLNHLWFQDAITRETVYET